MAQQTDIARAQTLAAEQSINIVPAWKKRELFTDKNGNDFPDRFEKEVKGEEIVLHEYATVLNHSKGFWARLRAFMSASTAAGRGAKAIKDFALLFVPYGKQIDTVTDFITERFIKSKRTNKTMEQKKPWYKSKTVNSIVAVIVLLLVQFFGVDIVAADIQAVITNVGVAVGSLIALYGRVTADKKIGKNN